VWVNVLKLFQCPKSEFLDVLLLQSRGSATPSIHLDNYMCHVFISPTECLLDSYILRT
jgi:hypothetical protein